MFSPLLDYKLETPYDYPISRLKLYYDLSSLKENSDYEEAKCRPVREFLRKMLTGRLSQVEMFASTWSPFPRTNSVLL
jgi:hypothetical protein